jgi:hypothetical protein
LEFVRHDLKTTRMTCIDPHGGHLFSVAAICAILLQL